MQTWQLLSVVTLILWGAWGIFAKLSANQGTAPLLMATLGSGAGFSVILIGQLVAGFPPVRPTLGIIYGLLAGTVGSIGLILFFYALRDGKASVVVPLTACYPILTILLGVTILKEDLSLTQGIGLGLAATGIMLLSR